MKDTAPTIEEMREVIHTFEMLSFKELQAQLKLWMEPRRLPIRERQLL